ncbi:response regulator, partial [Burkholderia contaminans]|nr:response regulator [Burkholderia contaminans]
SHLSPLHPHAVSTFHEDKHGQALHDLRLQHMHKILLIEDDQVIRQQIGKMLSEWGFEVVLVEDFMEVLSLCVQSEPHLVLMDIGLPLFNGYHWCQEIRKISKV